jgi:hypothetical protein
MLEARHGRLDSGSPAIAITKLVAGVLKSSRALSHTVVRARTRRCLFTLPLLFRRSVVRFRPTTLSGVASGVRVRIFYGQLSLWCLSVVRRIVRHGYILFFGLGHQRAAEDLNILKSSSPHRRCRFRMTRQSGIPTTSAPQFTRVKLRWRPICHLRLI